MSGVVAQSASALVGVWLMFAPAVLEYSGAPADNDRVVGPIAISVALIAIFEVVRGLRFLNAAAGTWLVLSAFVLPYPAAGIASAVLSGVALTILALPGGRTKNRYGGGWRAVLHREDRSARRDDG